MSQLLLNEMPSAIGDVFAEQGHDLLPRTSSDLITKCSCPDYASPCKHVAGVYYRIASLLDSDPLLLFQLRGMNFDQLQKKLAKTPLGQALIAQQGDSDTPVEYHAHRYCTPISKLRTGTDINAFWQGSNPIPQVVSCGDAVTPAILIKRGGDYPAFWHRDKSFVEFMETLYLRVAKQNKSVL